MAMTEENTLLQKLVDRSGYPFNMAVAETIRRSQNRQSWRVEAEEIPWSRMRESGFIDLAIVRDRAIGVIECKKVNNDDRLVFLVRQDQSPVQTRCKLEVYSRELPKSERGSGVQMLFESRFFVVDCNMPSGSPESSYCVAPKGGKSANLNLDGIASDLLESCEGLLGDWDYSLPGELTAAIPIIVTNARLYTCVFDPGQIDLGSVDLPSATMFQSQAFVRFRKAFRHSGGRFGRETTDTLMQVVEEGERTVFVVDSRHLVAFLAGLRALACCYPDDGKVHQFVKG